MEEPGRLPVSQIDPHLKIEEASYRRNYALSLIGPFIAAFGNVLVEFLRPARTVRVWNRLRSWALLAVDPVEDRCEDLGVQKIANENASSLVRKSRPSAGRAKK